jgi:pimeloyl-ACP methyl ester carboxylesterase
MKKAVILFLIISGFFLQAGYGQNSKGYAPVNGLKIYYEVQGSGEPIILLHGAYMAIEGPFREMMNTLSKNRKVIVMESQGHGRTADTDRPITFEHMADDVAALLKHLKIDSADVFGYSMGGGTALQLAIRHPKTVKKLIIASASYTSKGIQPELIKLMPTFKPEDLENTPFKAVYDSLAPNPKNFRVLVEKLKKLDETHFSWPAEAIKGIQSQTMLVFGDADVVTPEHMVEMFRLFGGGKMGDLGNLPNKRMAMLPGTTHIGVMGRMNWLMPMIEDFLTHNEITTIF